VYPGLISADTYLGLTEIGGRCAHPTTAPRRDAINPNVRAETAFNPESELIPVSRANGILTAVSSPAGGLISGTGAMMLMDGWTWEEMTFTSPAALYVSWPSMTINRSPWMRQTEEEQKKQRDQSIHELTGAFADARPTGGRKPPAAPISISAGNP